MSATSVATAKATVIPTRSIEPATTTKNPTKPNSPASRPRSTPMAAGAPCPRWAKTVRIAAYTGNGDSIPVKRGPSAGATATSTPTISVAASMRTGKSQRGSGAAVTAARCSTTGIARRPSTRTITTAHASRSSGARRPASAAVESANATLPPTKASGQPWRRASHA